MKTFLAGVIVATCITAGVNHVMATSTTTSVSACAHKKTGALRLKTGKKCKSTERPVSWPSSHAAPLAGEQGPAGTQGVAGQQGPTGVAGTPGIDGANGLSKAYRKNFRGGKIMTGDLEPKSIIGISLPAGDYIVSANLTATSDMAIVGICYFVGIALPSTIGLISSDNIADGSAVLQTHISLTSDDVLAINCWRTSGDNVIDIEGSIYAVAVDTITSYSPNFLCPSSLEDKSSVESMAC